MRDEFRYEECFEALRDDSYTRTPSIPIKDRLCNLIGGICAQNNKTLELYITLGDHTWRPDQQSRDKCRLQNLPLGYQLRGNGKRADAEVRSSHDGVLVDVSPSIRPSVSDYSKIAQNASEVDETSSAGEDYLHTKLVKEYADKQNITPEYVFGIIDSTPPRYLCTAYFMGFEGKGEGKDKKAAKHQSSKDLWPQLEATMR
jgi:hypothetical protein